MGYEAKETEHSGPKRGNGAYWGYKCEAKKESNRIRRENWKREIREERVNVAGASVAIFVGALRETPPDRPFRRGPAKPTGAPVLD